MRTRATERVFTCWPDRTLSFLTCIFELVGEIRDQKSRTLHRIPKYKFSCCENLKQGTKLGLNRRDKVHTSCQIKGLFTWREGAPANRATRLEGLTHSPPLHATHLTEAVSEMCGLLLVFSVTSFKIKIKTIQ